MKKASSIILIIIYTLLLVINVFFFMHRNKYNYNMYLSTATYGELYYHEETPRITNLNWRNDSITFEISPKELEIDNILLNDSLMPIKLVQNKVSLRLEKGINSIKLLSKSQKLDTFHLEVGTPIDENNRISIPSTNIPILTTKLTSLYQWKNNYNYLPKQELDKTRVILKNEIKISDTDSDEMKIKKISLFLLNKLDSKRGAPSDSMIYCTPYSQYLKALNNESKISCSNYSHIFSFFSNLAGVVTREISICGNFDDFVANRHVICESYISNLNQWAVVDLTSSKILVYNKSSKQPLNIINLYHLVRANVFDDIEACIYQEGQLIEKPYNEVYHTEMQYFKEEITFNYYLPLNYKLFYSGNGELSEKLKNYFFPRQKGFYYSEYTTNYFTSYFLRFVFLYTLILLVFLTIIYLFMKRLRKKGAPPEKLNSKTDYI